MTSSEKDLNKAKEKAKEVKLVAHDVHGVLTNNTFFCDVDGRRKYSFFISLSSLKRLIF